MTAEYTPRPALQVFRKRVDRRRRDAIDPSGNIRAAPASRSHLEVEIALRVGRHALEKSLVIDGVRGRRNYLAQFIGQLGSRLNLSPQVQSSTQHHASWIDEYSCQAEIRAIEVVRSEPLFSGLVERVQHVQE